MKRREEKRGENKSRNITPAISPSFTTLIIMFLIFLVCCIFFILDR